MGLVTGHRDNYWYFIDAGDVSAMESTQANDFDFFIHFSKGSKMPADASMVQAVMKNKLSGAQAGNDDYHNFMTRFEEYCKAHNIELPPRK